VNILFLKEYDVVEIPVVIPGNRNSQKYGEFEHFPSGN
jgi:hypothetical protein